jgi:hypothetical protein
MFSKYVISSINILIFSMTYGQIQKGFDIDGEAGGDKSGQFVSMPDENTVAIGANNNFGSGSSGGHARVYSWNGNTWVQKGTDIDSESGGDRQGPLDMPDQNTIVVGSIFNNSGGQQAGQVRIFYWDGSTWVQKGQNINGDIPGGAFGTNVSMPDINTVAAVGNCDYYTGITGITPSPPDFVRVFQWNGNSWVQKGSDILGWSSSEGTPAIDMPDANTIGIHFRCPNCYMAKSRIYSWNGSSWVQKGIDIDGDSGTTGYSVSMPDANTIAIGEEMYNGIGGQDVGRVRVYNYNGSAWIQKGAEVQGEAANDWFGNVSMPDPNTFVGGSYGSDINGDGSGNTRIFKWDGSTWNQYGTNIPGEFNGDASGKVSMPNSSTIAIGASSNDGNGSNAGHVRVYNLGTNGINTNQEISKNISVYPNPTNSLVQINYSNEIEKLEMIDSRGVILFKSTDNKNEFIIPESTQTGCYLLLIYTTDGLYRQKLFVQK